MAGIAEFVGVVENGPGSPRPFAIVARDGAVTSAYDLDADQARSLRAKVEAILFLSRRVAREIPVVKTWSSFTLAINGDRPGSAKYCDVTIAQARDLRGDLGRLLGSIEPAGGD